MPVWGNAVVFDHIAVALDERRSTLVAEGVFEVTDGARQIAGIHIV